MFERAPQNTLGAAAFRTGELIFRSAVYSVRKSHRSALFAILNSMMQTVVLVAVFYGMALFLPMMRGMAIRGDYLLYIMSGIFMYMVHIKSVTAVAGADNAASQMMQHLPMTTVVSVCSAALGALYIQLISVISVLYIYHIGWGPITISQPVGAMAMLLLSWFSGCCVGLIFFAAKPWAPGVFAIIMQFYVRVNMFASGKMFVANQIPSSLVAIFAWNPLFHIIDQGRGFIFVNYTPLRSEIEYPLYVSLGLLALGCIGSSYTRRHISASWTAGR